MSAVLATLYEAIVDLAIAIQPVIPASAAKLLDAMGVPESERSYAALEDEGRYARLAASGFILAAPSPIFPAPGDAGGGLASLHHRAAKLARKGRLSMADVVISYAPENEATARQLGEALARRGYEVWRPEGGSGAGNSDAVTDRIVAREGRHRHLVERGRRLRMGPRRGQYRARHEEARPGLGRRQSAAHPVRRRAGRVHLHLARRRRAIRAGKRSGPGWPALLAPRRRARAGA